MTHIQNLRYDVQFAETIETLRFVVDLRKDSLMLMQHVLYVTQPVIDQPELVVAQRCGYAT